MTIEKLKDLPELIKSGKMTVKQAIDEIGGFINQNYPVFSLKKYDEDFRSDIILMFFEKAKLYNNFSLDCKEIPPFKLFQICLHLIQK